MINTWNVLGKYTEQPFKRNIYNILFVGWTWIRFGFGVKLCVYTLEQRLICFSLFFYPLCVWFSDGVFYNRVMYTEFDLIKSLLILEMWWSLGEKRNRARENPKRKHLANGKICFGENKYDAKYSRRLVE